MESQYFLDFVDVDGFVELLDDAGVGFAGNPDFQFGIQIKGAGSFYAEPADGFVDDGFILGFASGNPLDID